jgi:CheY-like chemotaxis protein
LNGIIGYAQLLKIEGSLSIAQAKRVGAMLGAGTHLLEMINCVLDLSQIEAGRLETQAVELDPWTIAGSCVDLLRPAAEAKQLALRFIAGPAVPRHLMADPTRLRQVVFNLLGNAVKFTARGSVVLQLRTTDDGARLRLEVVDTGPGVPPERRQELFHDFARLDAVDAVEGTGLGLALSARLATLMGGCLGYEDNPGGGSVFWLELPLLSRPTLVLGDRTDTQPADLVPTVIAAPRTGKPATARPLRILVVDDTPMNRDIARSFLRMAGHEVLLAEDGAGAVEFAAAGNLDVVLMDVRMPKMDGLEATRRIRALQGSVGRVPIVALTAQVFAEQIEACCQAGMDSHLAKPFTQESLLAAVSNAITRLTEDRLTSDLPTCETSGHAQAANTVPATSSRVPG